ncbi:MAG TPA: sulfite exporter TauE/SafE family protein [Solirubrobacteraceae bacterium]|jgi:uncharacterized membrane protein YfcA|nr:sulfite exporter TauE/SafE family protein [Solirubrobacteraceae bacterium]
MDPLVILFGLGVGILVGMTGIGGGSLMTPLLLIVVGTQPVVAVGTDLAYGAITKTVGGLRHLRSGTVDLGVSKWLAFGSVPASVGGVFVGDAIAASADHALLWCVAGALFFVAFVTLTRALLMTRLVADERHSVPLTARTKGLAVTLGVVLGFILGITSVGSGALIGLALILVFRLVPHRVVGTDVLHAALMMWAAGIAQAALGHVDYGLMGTILIGSLPGVWIGERLVHRVPAAVLRPALGCVMLGSALGVTSKAGADLAAWQVVGPPIAAGLLAYAVHRARGRRRVAAPEPAEREAVAAA